VGSRVEPKLSDRAVVRDERLVRADEAERDRLDAVGNGVGIEAPKLELVLAPHEVTDSIDAGGRQVGSRSEIGKRLECEDVVACTAPQHIGARAALEAIGSAMPFENVA
jgi:hypothetical protein